MFWVWHKTVYDGETPILEIYEVWTTFFMLSLPGSLWPRVVVPVKVLSMGKIDVWKLFIFDTFKKQLPKNVNMNIK